MKSNYKIYGNPTTKVCHARNKRGDACYERALKRGNSEHFENWEQAKRYGYRACKRCKPDQVK